jgi:hypothetical protein
MTANGRSETLARNLTEGLLHIEYCWQAAADPSRRQELLIRCCR